MTSSTQLRISEPQFERAIEQLGQFVAIPSVSNTGSPDYDMRQLEAAANFATGKLKEIDFTAEQIRINGCAPYVVARKTVDAAAPTFLLYGHYDVQPVDRDKWGGKDPFVMERRDGRLYGRGASDDKGGIIAIIAALNTFREANRALKVNIIVFLEGEEEFDSKTMDAFLKQNAASIHAEALIIMDGANKDLHTGTLTSSTRGLVNLELTLKALGKPVHSGLGCLVPDPMQEMAKLIGSLSFPRGIPGCMEGADELTAGERDILRQGSKSAEQYAAELGVVKGAKLRGNPEESIDERIMSEPSISVVNATCGMKSGGNSIQDTARCQIGIRVLPGQNPDKVGEAVMHHLRNQATLWNTPIEVNQMGEGAFAWKANLTGKYSTQYLKALGEHFPAAGVSPCGGALPLLKQFQDHFPTMEMIVPGVEDPDCAAHSHNESQDVNVLKNSINALISFLDQAGN